jgi:hypothetical protein
VPENRRRGDHLLLGPFLRHFTLHVLADVERLVKGSLHFGLVVLALEGHFLLFFWLKLLPLLLLRLPLPEEQIIESVPVDPKLFTRRQFH